MNQSNPAMSDGCGGCGNDPKQITDTLKGAMLLLINAHTGVREMYKVLATNAGDEGAAQLYRAEAAKHDRIITEISDFVVPDEEELHAGTVAHHEPGGAG